MRQAEDRFVRVLLANFLSPTSGAGFDGQAVTLSKREDRAEQTPWIVDFRAKAMNLHQIEVSETVDAAAADQPLELREILVECLVSPSTRDLTFLIRSIEHLDFTVKVVHRPKHEIEMLPIPLHPAEARIRGNRVIIQFDPDENFNILVSLAQALHDIEINAGMVAVMIGESQTSDLLLAASCNPGLQQVQRIRPDLMSLRMSVVVSGEEHFKELRSCRSVPLLVG